MSSASEAEVRATTMKSVEVREVSHVTLISKSSLVESGSMGEAILDVLFKQPIK